MSNLNRWLLAAVPILLVPALLFWFWPRPRDVMYSLYRERGKAQTLAGLDGYQSKESQHYEIWYTDADEKNVDMILKTAETVYGPVVKAVGFQADKVPLIVYPDRTVLRKAFGWGSSESAMGVYWQGTVRLLSPNAWIDEQTDKSRARVFRKLNPIAHELTHYLLDYKTSGNYPRWFTEGLAQRVEHDVTGYLWIENKSTLRQNLYSLSDLESHFDQLDNQPLAYRESFLLVDYLASTYGKAQMSALVERLGNGISFGDAVRMTYGKSIGQIHDDWADWVKDNLDELDPTG
ncbi:MAG TPA: peptidase MA family metallohydrolase [Symbiobacteriaceae bacterium]|jgi:hypothetical protein